MTAFRITARRDGFRRAGLSHPASPVEHRVGIFTDEQIEALLAEPMLIVEPSGMPLERWLEEADADRERLAEEEAAKAAALADAAGKRGKGSK
jgi:hypothetical protein